MTDGALPPRWYWSTIGALCSKPEYGWTTKATPAGQTRFLRTTDISGPFIDWETVPFCRLEPAKGRRFRLQQGDIVISRAGSVGVSKLIGPCPDAVFASYLIRFRPNGINGKYLAYFLQGPSYWSEIAAKAAGIALQNVNAKKLAAIPIPVAPPSEQTVIVAEIEKQFTRLDSGVEALRRAQAHLRRYQAAVLKAAYDGTLLQKGLGQAAWRWAKLEECAEAIVDCPHSTPRWTDSGRLCVRTTEFSVSGLRLHNGLRYVSEETYAERTARIVPRGGDVLYSREGAILGIACVVPPGVQLCLGQRMMLVRPRRTVDGRWISAMLNSPQTLTQVKSLTGGSASPHINVRDVKNFRIPLPSQTEQSALADEVDRQFSTISESSSAIEADLARSVRLRSSILRAAFEGRLVASGPSASTRVA